MKTEKKTINYPPQKTHKHKKFVSLIQRRTMMLLNRLGINRKTFTPKKTKKKQKL